MMKHDDRRSDVSVGIAREPFDDRDRGRRRALSRGLTGLATLAGIAGGVTGDGFLGAPARAQSPEPLPGRVPPVPAAVTTSSADPSRPASASPVAWPPRQGPDSRPADPLPRPRPRAIILNSRDASVSLIDQDRLAEVDRVTVGKEPHHLYPTPDNSELIVACSASDDLYLLDPDSGEVRNRVRRIDDPYQLAYSPNQRWFVTAALRLDRVDIYRHEGSAFLISARLPMARLPSHLWFSADNRHVFVTLQGSDEIAAIDVESQTMLWRMPVGRQPAGILVSPDDQLLYVGVMGEDHVAVIDWRRQQLVSRIRTGNGAHNFRGVGDGRHLLVSNRVAGTVSVIDMARREVVSEFASAGGPDCMELADDGRTLWVTTRWNKRVNVVDLFSGQIIARIPVGRSPHGVYLHNRAALI